MKKVANWFEQSWGLLFAFSEERDIPDFNLASWSQYLNEDNPHYLFNYINEINRFFCPFFGDGKWKFLVC